jgi:hypothetical protein
MPAINTLGLPWVRIGTNHTNQAVRVCVRVLYVYLISKYHKYNILYSK